MLAFRLLSEGVEGPNTELLWLMYVGIGIFFVVILAGWLFGSKEQEQPAAGVGADSKKANPVDNLSKIEGIGPKVVKVLNKSGIDSFEALAHANVSEIRKSLKDAGLQMMDPEGWIDQAKLAAKGDWDGFEKLQRELKGGRRK